MKTKFRWPAFLTIRPLGIIFRRMIEKWGSDDLRLPVVGSAILHLVLIVGLFVVIPSTVEDRRVNPTPRFVTARVVTLEQKAKPRPVKKTAPKIAPKKQPVKKLAPKKPVVKPKPKLDKKVIALKKKQDDDKRRKELAEQVRKDKEKADLAERERLQKLREQEKLAALAREKESQRRTAVQAQADQLTVAGYEDVIAGLVAAQWSRPPSARKGMYVTLRIRLAPTGEVISVTRVSGRGNDAFDRSAELAINRAAPFREIQGMESRLFEQNFREFKFEFRPEDLLE